MKTLFTSVIFAVITAVSFGQVNSFVFSYTGSPQSYISLGQSQIVSTGTGYSLMSIGSFYENHSVNQEISFWFRKPATATTASSSWTVTFAVPTGSSFQVGTTYTATRFPFQDSSHSGLDFSGDGRGNNTLSGWFKVYDFVTGSDGKVVSAAFDFYQLDSNNAEWWNFGSIRYNSAIEITTYSASAIPEPSTYAVIIGVAALIIALWYRRKATTNNSVLSVG